MTRCLRLDLTDDARRDFRSILRYTRRAWGERKKDTYAVRLNDAMEYLTRFPLLGESRDDLRTGMRARPVAEHVIYYRVDKEAIIVLRLLHHTMDERAQFGE
jgi:toxin ParE1/3/4